MDAFQLISLPDEKSRHRIYLLQLPYKTEKIPAVEKPQTLADLDGPGLDAVEPVVKEVLTNAKVEVPASFFTKGGSILLPEDLALRVGLMFIATSGLRSADRIKKIIEGVQAMDPAFASHWIRHALSGPTENVQYSLRAMFIGQH